MMKQSVYLNDEAKGSPQRKDKLKLPRGLLELGDAHDPFVGELDWGKLVPEHEALVLQPVAQSKLGVGRGRQVEDAGPM